MAWFVVRAVALVAALACATPCMVSCNSILGIEQSRALDVSPLSVDGYLGCEPEEGECSACTSSWHTCVCTGWFAEAGDKRRRDLQWDCAQDSPPPEGVALKPLQTAYEEYEDERVSDDEAEASDDEAEASDDDGKASDDDTEPPDTTAPGLQCSPDDDCKRCGHSCWAQCACDSGADGSCKERCGNEACTEDNGCSVCNDCVDECLCQGGNPLECRRDCGPPGGLDCHPEQNCACEGECFENCRCEGGAVAECEERCEL